VVYRLRPIVFLSLALLVVAGVLTWRFAGRSGTTQVKGEENRRQAHLFRDHPREAQDFFRLKRAPAGKTEVPMDRYVAAAEMLDAMPRHSAARARIFGSLRQMRRPGMSDLAVETRLGTWEELGPGNIGGRTRALVIEKEDPRVMYAAGVAGGVWKTEDGGRTWAPLDDLMANLGVTSLAMNPGNSDVLYAGTGEIQAADGVRGAGIFRTDNGGASWDQLANTKSEDFHLVSDIVVSSQDPSRVYTATGTGVWRSLNEGKDWARILDTQGQGGCLDLALRTDKTTDVLFAACQMAPGRSSVLRNPAAEGTGSWEEVLSEGDMGRTSLALAPSNQEVIYALAASQALGSDGNPKNNLHAVFRSTQGGRAGTWTARIRNSSANRLGTLLLTNPRDASFVLCRLGKEDSLLNQGDYDNVIAVDPVNPGRVWAGGIDLFRSDDGGATWGLASFWWFDRGKTGYLHADQHALVFHPRYDGSTNKTLFIANDGGIFRTENALAPTTTGAMAPCGLDAHFTWTPLSNGYRVTQFYHGAPFPDGDTYFGGTQDNGTLLGKDTAGRDAWATLLGGDGGDVAVDPKDPDVLYAEFTNLSLQKSTDRGQGFNEMIRGIDPKDPFLFIAPFVMDPEDSRRLWLGGQVLWRTNDGAENWEAASPRLAAKEHGISAIAVAPSDPERMLVGTSDGRIYRTLSGRTSDKSTSWPHVRPQKQYVSSLAFDPVDPKIAYATYSNFGLKHVWKSTDEGASWSPLDVAGTSRKFPDIPVLSIVVDPANRSHLYIGTDLGIFASMNGGDTWEVENTGFPNVMTEYLTSRTAPDGSVTLFAFTHGRGAWRVRLPDRVSQGTEGRRLR
jgi:photosystem II stability/assembly factor-like uncharacterized protein